MTRVGIGSWVIGLALGLPATALAQEAYTTTAVNLRAGPDVDYPLVRWVPEGTPVEVRGCLGDFQWCDVEVFGDRGWMYAKYLVYPYQNSHVPIVSYGPVIGLPVFGFSIDYWDDHYRGRPWYNDRPRWMHRYRPEYHSPQYREPRYREPRYREPQYRPPQNRPPQYYPPGIRPEFHPPGVRQEVRPPVGGPSYRPPDVRPTPRPDYRPPNVNSSPRPTFRPPEVSRPAAPPPMARPPAPSPSRGPDPRTLRNNAGEVGGMPSGNF